LAVTATLGLALAVTPTAYAAGGLSTPGVTVIAVNPGTAPDGSSIKLTLTAHTENSTVPDPSCRPQDMTLECWGSLVLRVPAEGGLSVSDFEVHRVAVGDTSCGDDEGGDSCGGDMASAAVATSSTTRVQVNGVGVLTDPGNLPYPAGTKVQLKISLTDYGRVQYRDEVDVQINLFQPGMTKWPLYTSGPQRVQQVQVHLTGPQH
jgi:hypothetical protein